MQLLKPHGRQVKHHIYFPLTTINCFINRDVINIFYFNIYLQWILEEVEALANCGLEPNKCDPSFTIFNIYYLPVLGTVSGAVSYLKIG